MAREDIYLLFYEFSEFFDEKQLFNAGSKITKIADRNGRHIGCPNSARGWSDLPNHVKGYTTSLCLDLNLITDRLLG